MSVVDWLFAECEGRDAIRLVPTGWPAERTLTSEERHESAVRMRVRHERNRAAEGGIRHAV